jgi:hypothetical protein
MHLKVHVPFYFIAQGLWHALDEPPGFTPLLDPPGFRLDISTDSAHAPYRQIDRIVIPSSLTSRRFTVVFTDATFSFFEA